MALVAALCVEGYRISIGFEIRNCCERDGDLIKVQEKPFKIFTGVGRTLIRRISVCEIPLIFKRGELTQVIVDSEIELIENIVLGGIEVVYFTSAPS